MPAALLLQREDATVTVIHSRTPDAQRICAEADIIIAACGRAEMVEGDWVKPGAAVIDVGINAVDVSARGGPARAAAGPPAPAGRLCRPPPARTPCLLLLLSSAHSRSARRWLTPFPPPRRTPPPSAATAWWATSTLARPRSAPARSRPCPAAWAPWCAAAPAPPSMNHRLPGCRGLGDSAPLPGAALTQASSSTAPPTQTIAMLLRNCVDGAARAFAAGQ